MGCLHISFHYSFEEIYNRNNVCLPVIECDLCDAILIPTLKGDFKSIDVETIGEDFSGYRWERPVRQVEVMPGLWMVDL